jgi:long-chain acyl-CoA synthetase
MGERAPLSYPAVPVDGLLREAARRWPTRTALGGVVFAELDASVQRVAAALARLLDGTGHACGVASVLHPDFARAFYAVARSGNYAVTLNPLHREEAVVRALRTTRARLAFLGADMYRRLAPRLVEELPDLRTVVLVGPLGERPAGVPVLADLDAGDGGPLPVVDPESVACVHFTSGTTGEPKGVRLRHRNLVANALQTVQAHGLDATSVTLNHLPLYHLMHLNAGMRAGATQVLHDGEDPVEALRRAVAVGATHYYSLPVRLARLAADPRLRTVPAGRLRGLFSGGSALPAPAAVALRETLGVPVVQGYGLAETSSMTHLDDPAGPRAGSVGPPAADTRCRIVDADTGSALPAGRKGEVQVRGPQVMAGYLDGSPGVHAGGWLSTGDIGYLDDDGWLYVVDRRGDVFKYDNELVAPTEIERELAALAQVADCAVVDRPDPVHGAVPYALVVLADPRVALAEVVAAANARLAPFQHIRDARAVPQIPRSRLGKIIRRDLRALVRPSGETMLTLINEFVVTGDVAEFEAVLAEFNAYMSAQPGAGGYRLLRSTRRPNVFVELAEWSDAGAHQEAVRSPGFPALVARLRTLVDKSIPDLYETVRASATAGTP